MRATPHLTLALLVSLSAGCVVEDRDRGEDGGAVIVSFRRQISLTSFERTGRTARSRLLGALRAEAELSQARALALLRHHGVEPGRRLWAVNALVVRAPSAVLDELAALPEVESVRSDLELERPRRDQPVPSLHDDDDDGLQHLLPLELRWNLTLVGAPALWAKGRRGDGVVVAGMDTGVDGKHPALAGRFQGGWFDPYNQHSTPVDLDGHGTRTMGVILGSPAERDGVAVGVAPGARWMAARIWNDAGKAWLSAIHLAFEWLLDPDGDPRTDDAPDVVNGSWGFDNLAGKCFKEFEPDLAALRAAGIAAVFSAGNSGPATATSTSPANNPFALAIGAIDAAGAVEKNSSRGPSACGGGLFPQLVAPGVDILTTDRTLGGAFPESYALVSGTSIAAPHAAGAMALLLGAYPEAGPADLEEALAGSAKDLGAAGPDATFGHGRLDAAAAMERLQEQMAVLRCADADGDGYFARGRCGTAVDCDDADAARHPGADDPPGDGLDQDCDGLDGELGL